MQYYQFWDYMFWYTENKGISYGKLYEIDYLNIYKKKCIVNLNPNSSLKYTCETMYNVILCLVDFVPLEEPFVMQEVNNIIVLQNCMYIYNSNKKILRYICVKQQYFCTVLKNNVLPLLAKLNVQTFLFSINTNVVFRKCINSFHKLFTKIFINNIIYYTNTKSFNILYL